MRTMHLHMLGKAEVAQLEVSGLIKEQVFWFQIAVENIVRVEMFKHEHDTGGGDED
jgi:hypothetical protein